MRSLERASPHPVEIGPADLAEGQKRIGIGALGQCLFRELPEIDTRPQGNLHNGSEHGLRSTHNIVRGEQPHSVDEPDQALLIAGGRDVVVREGVQQHIRRTHDEISVNGFSLGDLACDALKAILMALSVNGGA
jgi:hypothetical protein